VILSRKNDQNAVILPRSIRRLKDFSLDLTPEVAESEARRARRLSKIKIAGEPFPDSHYLGNKTMTVDS
jgi:hypothetical protein